LSRVIKSPSISPKAFHVPEPGTAAAKVPSPQEPERKKVDVEAEVQRKLQQARAQAEAILKEAEAEREQLLAQARLEAKRLEAAVREEGLKLGREQGREEIEQAMKERAEAFESSVLALQQALQQDKDRLVRQTEPQLIELACAIAGRIVREEVDRNDEVVLRIVQKAIDLATEKEKLVIRLNPADIEWVRQHCHQLQASHDDLGELCLEEDPRIEQGGCVIETETGNVDARLERQMEEIERDLRESI